MRQRLPLLEVAAGRVLNSLLLAFSGDACALGSGFLGILLRDPADPVRPPAALGLGRARDKIVERRGLIVAGPILIFARCGRVDHLRDTARARWQESLRSRQMIHQTPDAGERRGMIPA